jgi:hypothetical protein
VIGLEDLRFRQPCYPFEEHPNGGGGSRLGAFLVDLHERLVDHLGNLNGSSPMPLKSA